MNIWLVTSESNMMKDNAFQLFGLIVLFCFVIAATYLTSKFVGQYKLGQMKNRNFKVIETYKVSPNKFLQLIKVGEKCIVIGIGKDEIHKIAELSLDQVNMIQEEGQNGMKFSELIAKMQAKHINKQNTHDTKNDEDQ